MPGFPASISSLLQICGKWGCVFFFPGDGLGTLELIKMGKVLVIFFPLKVRTNVQTQSRVQVGTWLSLSLFLVTS